MLQHLAVQLAAASVLIAAAPGALAQTPPPATPSTRILAIGTFVSGTDMQLVQRTLAAEMRATDISRPPTTAARRASRAADRLMRALLISVSLG